MAEETSGLPGARPLKGMVRLRSLLWFFTPSSASKHLLLAQWHRLDPYHVHFHVPGT